jgi:carboxymethylenebutenolidase
MIDRTESPRTTDGAMNVFVTHPGGEGPFPVVVQLMDGLGMREELREHARRTAAMGYYVLAPDLFHRLTWEGTLDTSTPEGLAKVRGLLKQVTNAHAISDVEDALAIAAGDKAAAKGKIGVYGFCMGGRLTLVIAQALGERVAAAASIHPGGLSTDQPDSPHRHVDNVKAEMYFGIADKDPSATPEQIEELEKALKAKGIAYQVEWHPGALHGYMMASRKDLYNRDAAEKVWGRLQALFGRKVG